MYRGIETSFILFFTLCGLTQWGRETHICVSKLTTIASDNDLSPGRRQAIIWTNAEILLIGPLGINLSEILGEIHTFSFKKMRLKRSSGKWRPFYLGLNVLNTLMATFMESPIQHCIGVDLIGIYLYRRWGRLRNGVVLISTAHYLTNWMTNAVQSQEFTIGTDWNGSHPILLSLWVRSA